MRRDGIRIFAIQYWDNVLSPLADRSPQLMDIRYDPRNLSRIFLRHADGTVWAIPYARSHEPRDLRRRVLGMVGSMFSRHDRFDRWFRPTFLRLH